MSEQVEPAVMPSEQPMENSLQDKALNTTEQTLDVLESTMDTFLARADVTAVYSEPVEKGDTLVITAAEVMAGFGFGIGGGGGSGGPNGAANKKEGVEAAAAAGGSPTGGGAGVGAGGGGGGQAFARPVAVISVGPQGVSVQPVIDLTKIGLAAITAFGFMIATLAKFRRGR